MQLTKRSIHREYIKGAFEECGLKSFRVGITSMKKEDLIQFICNLVDKENPKEAYNILKERMDELLNNPLRVLSKSRKYKPEEIRAQL